MLVCFTGDWDVNWGYGLLTHGHVCVCVRSMRKDPDFELVKRADHQKIAGSRCEPRAPDKSKANSTGNSSEACCLPTCSQASGSIDAFGLGRWA